MRARDPATERGIHGEEEVCIGTSPSATPAVNIYASHTWDGV
jgi:hypothetical protein